MGLQSNLQVTPAVGYRGPQVLPVSIMQGSLPEAVQTQYQPLVAPTYPTYQPNAMPLQAIYLLQPVTMQYSTHLLPSGVVMQPQQLLHQSTPTPVALQQAAQQPSPVIYSLPTGQAQTYQLGNQHQHVYLPMCFHQLSQSISWGLQHQNQLHISFAGSVWATTSVLVSTHII